MDSELKPLYANLKRIYIGHYLSTDSFKHLAIEKDFDEEWNDCLSFITDTRKHFSAITFTQDYNRDCEEAFGILMDNWYENQSSTFDDWIMGVLLNYAMWNNFKIDFSSIVENFKELDFSNDDIIKFLKEIKKIEPTKLVMGKATKEKIEIPVKKSSLSTNKVFIVHGHDEKSRYELCNILKDELQLEPIVLLEKPNNSIETIISKFERLAKDCSYAIILLTPDDLVGENRRARQNVVFELGYFLGKFQTEQERKIIIMKKSGVEIPSDISGVLYLEYNKDVKEVYLDLKRQFQHWKHQNE